MLEADQEALEVCGSKSKIKYTPFKATSARSPVIVSQTKLGSRSSAFNKFVFAHAVHRYEFSSAPVCRQGYPMYRSYVSIPGERERLLDDKGNLCLDTSAGSQTMKEGIKDNLVDLRTTMKYRNGETKTLYGLTTQCPLKTSEDTKDQGFEVASLARYNTSIVTGTTCKEVSKTVEGAMIILNETNPNGSCQLNINKKLLSSVVTLFVFINTFRYS